MIPGFLLVLLLVLTWNKTSMPIKRGAKKAPWSCQFSRQAIKAMRKGKVLGPKETPKDLVERLVKFIAFIEATYFPDHPGQASFLKVLRESIVSREIVPGTPILLKAGRSDGSLSACCILPIGLNEDRRKVKRMMNIYHQDGMGIGFNLDEVADPVAMLLDLNAEARRHQAEGTLDRPVGNMAVLSVSHPRIAEFLEVKLKHPMFEWVFCTSVNIDDAFMKAVKTGSECVLKDDTKVDARALFNKMAEAAGKTGEPALLFMDRMSGRSPIQQDQEEVCTPPCAEMSLTKGETCQFVYINIAQLLTKDDIDYERLGRVVELTVRLLDDIVEHNVHHHRFEGSRQMTRRYRKIGLGICGLSDALVTLGIPFGSRQAVRLTAEVLSFINLRSKEASVELSDVRGPFEGFEQSAYRIEVGFLYRKFGRFRTKNASENDWRRLDKEIKKRGIRNSMTIILPPTGRSAPMFDASQQMEPIFRLYNKGMGFNRQLLVYLKEEYAPEVVHKALRKVRKDGSILGAAGISRRTKRLFRTSIEIPYKEHLAMLGAAQRFTDESVSKTVNLPRDTRPRRIKRIFWMAYRMGLNGISVYRDGSRNDQPVNLR